jgi:hypothetical protein
MSQPSSLQVRGLRQRLTDIGPALQAKVARGELTIAAAEREQRRTIVQVRPGIWIGRIRAAR